MNDQAKQIAEAYEQRWPDLWSQCYPRNYSGVGQYESPRYVAVIIASSIGWTTGEAREYAPLTARHIAMSASKAFENNLPAFFVTSEFLEAICFTELPDDIKWTEAKLPYEAGLYYLPPGLLRDPEGYSINVLGWGRVYAGEPLEVWGNPVNLTDDCFMVFAMCDSDVERLYSTAVPASETPYIKWQTYATAPASPFDMEITPEDQAFLHQLVCIVFGLLLAQIAKPSIVSEGKREKQKKPQRRETWSPNVVGKGYVAKREHQGGSHASPRLHWRKGHFRAQRHGSGREQIKTIWIEPTLVGE